MSCTRLLSPMTLTLRSVIAIQVHKNMQNGRDQPQLELFFMHGPPEYVGTDILGLQPKTKDGNQLVINMTDRYTELTKAQQTQNLNVTIVPRIFRKHQKASFGFSSERLTDQEPSSCLSFSWLSTVQLGWHCHHQVLFANKRTGGAS